MMTMATKAIALMEMMPTAMSVTAVAAMATHDYGGDGDDHAGDGNDARMAAAMVMAAMSMVAAGW